MLKGWVKATFDEDSGGLRVYPYLREDIWLDPLEFQEMVDEGIIVVDKEDE